MKDQREFRVTMIDNASLVERLVQELRFLLHQLRKAWPRLKRDPVGFCRDIFAAGWLQLQRGPSRNSLAAFVTAILLLVSAGLLLVLVDRRSRESNRLLSARPESAQMIEFLPNADIKKEGEGVGANSNGRVGLAAGKGEGSAPQHKRAMGGGGGGEHDPLPAQVGKVPPPSEIPAPIPKFPPAQSQTLAVAGLNLDPVLWKDLPAANYGDPRSKSSAPSNGSGDGGGMGTGNGQGIGEGDRSGFGPGRDGNIGGGSNERGGDGVGGSRGNNADDPDRIYPAPQVTERARVLAKPEPQYTEEARRNAITGSVVLRVVFSRNGEVTNIRALQALPFGLTERAIAAARLIRFRPATRDGRAVNVYVQLEYNFNLY
jgi:TonB family protein